MLLLSRNGRLSTTSDLWLGFGQKVTETKEDRDKAAENCRHVGLYSDMWEKGQQRTRPKYVRQYTWHSVVALYEKVTKFLAKQRLSIVGGAFLKAKFNIICHNP